MTGGGGNGNGNGDDACEEEKPKLVVEKIVVNDDGGTATPDDFSFQVNGGPAQQFESDGRNALEVDPGTYTVTEPPVSGYTTTYDNCTDLVLDKGDREVCTITNDDEPAPPTWSRHRREGHERRHGHLRVHRHSGGIHLGRWRHDLGRCRRRPVHVDGAADGRLESRSIGCDDENSSGSISQRTATFRVEEARRSPAPSATGSEAW